VTSDPLRDLVAHELEAARSQRARDEAQSTAPTLLTRA
jgi:hypothetical protein